MKTLIPSLACLGAHTAFTASLPSHHNVKARYGSQPAPASTGAATIFSLATTPSWLENLAYRPSSNTFLATRLDVPQVWSVEPRTQTGTLVANVSGATALAGITQLSSAGPRRSSCSKSPSSSAGDDVFIFAGINYTLTTGLTPNSSTLWSLTFPSPSSEDAAGSRLPMPVPVLALPGVGMINGITTWDSHTILAADSTGGAIWKVDITSHTASIMLQDPTMAPYANAPSPLGPNGVKVYRRHPFSSSADNNTYVYYTSSNQGLLARIPVDQATAAAAGPAQVIASGFPSPDDFALLDDGSVVLATGSQDTAVHVALDGAVTTLAGDTGELVLASSTSCALGREGQVFVTTAGGLEAKVNGTAVGPGSVARLELDLILRPRSGPV